jgi:hypothetical protein
MTEQERIQIIEEFVEFCAANLKIEELPKMTFIDDKSWVLTNHSFGQYKNDSRHITVYIANRNLADTLRTVAHELTHHKQNELGLLYSGAGETGSPIENEANSVAGMLMRNFGLKHEIIYENTNISILKILLESTDNNQFYHGSTSKSLDGKRGIHIGTKLAATQALQARIGVPAEGEWDGTREYGKTKLAGKKTLAKFDETKGYYVSTGYNVGSDVPEDDYYPQDRQNKPYYSDGTEINMHSKPIVFPVDIIGTMNNTKYTPKTDTMANSLIMRGIKKGNAKNGFYYINDGEDAGSISAVVPDKSFLKVK